MSLKAIYAVFDLNPTLVTPPERLVLLTLARYADDHGHNARPAVGTIRRRTSLGLRTIRRALLTLQQKGFIVPVSKSWRGTVRYDITIDGLSVIKGDKSLVGRSGTQGEPLYAGAAHKGTNGTCAAVAQEGCQSGTGGVPERHSMGATAAHNLSLSVLDLSLKEEPRAARAPSLPAQPEENGKNGHGKNGTNGQTSLEGVTAAELFRLLPERQQLDLLAQQCFEARGFDAAFPDLEADFTDRARRFEVPLDQVNVAVYLWNFKKAHGRVQ